MIGRTGILHHNFPLLAVEDPDFVSRKLPVSAAILKVEGLSETFIDYMKGGG
jgi:hypothetical protein